MFFTVLIMLVGLGLALNGIQRHDEHQAYIGLITIGVVCASWWFWVMFVIRTVIKSTNKTIETISTIKADIREVRNILLDK